MILGRKYAWRVLRLKNVREVHKTVLSIQVRCLGLLSMPTFCDKSGQHVLVTMVLAYVLAGPLTNIARNGSEVIRVFTCSSEMVYNLTKTRYELMFKPFQEALFNLKVRLYPATRVYGELSVLQNEQTKSCVSRRQQRKYRIIKMVSERVLNNISYFQNLRIPN